MKFLKGIQTYHKVMKRLNQDMQQSVVDDAKKMRERYINEMKMATTSEEFSNAKSMVNWCNDRIVENGGIGERRK